MASRNYPMARIAVADAGPDYIPQLHGYGRCDWPSTIEMPEFADRSMGPWILETNLSQEGYHPAGVCTGVIAREIQGTEDLWYATAGLSTVVQYPGKIKPLILTPCHNNKGWDSKEAWGSIYKYVTYHIDLNYFDLLTFGESSSEYTNMWSDRGLVAEDAPFPLIQFTNGKSAIWSGVKSRFTLPTNPIMCLGLWQASPPNPTAATPSDRKHPTATWIRFGECAQSAFSLEVSNTHSPNLYWRHQTHTNNLWEELPPMGGEEPGPYGANVYNEKKWASGEQSAAKLLWIGCFARGIAISTSAWVSDCIFYPFPPKEPTVDMYADSCVTVNVAPAPLQLSHFSGQWAFSFIPVVMPSLGYWLSPQYEIPYPHQANVNAASIYIIQRPVIDFIDNTLIEGARATGVDCTGKWPSKLLTTDYKYQYYIQLQAEYNDLLCTSGDSFGNQQANPLSSGQSRTSLSFPMWRSPEVYGAIYSKGTDFSSEVRTYTYYDAPTFSLATDMSNTGIRGEIVLDNQLGQWRNWFSDQAPCRTKISGSWVMSDGTIHSAINTAMFDGYMGERSGTMQKGKVGASAELYDAFQVLQDLESDGSIPPFDGWALHSDFGSLNVFTWISNYTGIVITPENLIGTGTGIGFLNSGPLGQSYWTIREGTSWLSFLKEIGMYMGCAGMTGGSSIVFCCPHCRTQRTATLASSTYWLKHRGPASEGCLAADVTRAGNANGVDFLLWTDSDARNAIYPAYSADDAATNEILRLSPPLMSIDDMYANEISVTGPAYNVKYRDSYTNTWTDWGSVWGGTSYFGTSGLSLGRKKKATFEYEWANNNALRSMLVAFIGSDMAMRPEVVEVVIPFAPTAGLGMVFSIAGGDEYGLNSRKYRIIGVSHENVSIANPGCTTLVGRYIGSYVCT